MISFIATEELGKLAKWLRVLGHDCDYYGKEDESELVIKVLRDGRVLLTRGSRFSKYHGIRVIVITSDHVEDQVEQLVKEAGLELAEHRLFQRCVECNVELVPVEKDAVKEKVPEYVFETNDDFKKCEKCGKIFWKGTHWDNVARKFKQLKKDQQKET